MGCIVISSGSLAFMPITIGSLPFDLVFFYVGVLTRRNQWLDEDKDTNITIHNDDNDGNENNIEQLTADKKSMYENVSLPSKGSLVSYLENNRLLNYSIAVTMCVSFLVCLVIIYVQDLDTLIFQNTTSGDDENIDDDTVRGDIPSPQPSVLVFLIISGVMTVFISLCVLDMSRKYLDFESILTKYLSKAAYGVYIFHPFFIQIFVLIWVELVIPKRIYWQDNGQSTTNVGSEAWLWGGFFICTLFIVPTCFVFSAWIRQFFPNIL